MNTNTTVMLNELYRIFDALNERYFDNSLPEIFIVLQKGKSKNQNVYGTFTPESWVHNDGEEEDEFGNKIVKSSDPHHEIAMSAEYFTRPTPNWCATLCHEMVHLYCQVNDIEDTSNNGRYHNKRFKVEAEKRGLIIEKGDTIGWSLTTPNADFVDFIDELEVDTKAFEWFRDTKLDLSATKPSKKRYVCPICGLEVQAKKDKLIKCCECDKVMDYWDLVAEEMLADNNDGLAMSEEGWYNNQ